MEYLILFIFLTHLHLHVYRKAIFFPYFMSLYPNTVMWASALIFSSVQWYAKIIHAFYSCQDTKS